MIDLGDSPVTLDPDNPVERAMIAVAVERRKRRRVAAEWDDRFDFPVAVLLDLLDELEAPQTPPARLAGSGPEEADGAASGPETRQRGHA